MTFLRSYELYLSSKATSVLYFTILVHLLLPIIEEPSVIDVPFLVPCVIEIICLLVYLVRWFHARSFQPAIAFNSDKKNYVAITIILVSYSYFHFFIHLFHKVNHDFLKLILVDILQYTIVNVLDVGFKHRFTRFMRILIYINFNEGKELRRAIRNVRKTLPDILNVFALFFLSLLIFAFLAWQLFRNKL